ADGEPAMPALRKERLSIDDLMIAAREAGIARFSDIKLAVLEVNGRISFFAQSAGDSSGAPDPSPVGT
ncbi:MAG: DUF421 domain-containing protein, partial [Gemmatimonadota bacterium]|nr:DUF421 domain-containing protein [Gemmatimonadota bacterium]